MYSYTELDRTGGIAMDTEDSRTAKLNALEVVEMIMAYSTLGSDTPFWRVPIQAIHTALKRLKDRYPQPLAGLCFSEHTLKPYSRSIEGAIASLGAAGLVTIENPRFKWLSIKHEDREGFRTYLDYLDEQIHSQMCEVARAFDEEIAELTT